MSTPVPPSSPRRRLSRPGRLTALSAVAVLIAAGFIGFSSPAADATDPVVTHVSTFTASDGQIFTATNHLVQDSPEVAKAKQDARVRHEYLVVWAGDENAADTSQTEFTGTGLLGAGAEAQDTLTSKSVGPDFLAVIDATKNSPTYGKVVNTVTLGPVAENEPHHMQYIWGKGDSIYAGGLYSDITYVFDIKALPKVELSGVNLPTDTPCSSIPDAFFTLDDGTAYGTYMGGANVPGPCTYTNGETRISNGFGGSPGAIVHMSPDGKTLSEVPASSPTSEGANCVNIPALPVNTCANPHGIQVREDLDLLVSSDYVEPRNIVLDPVPAMDPNLLRNTVRVFDISERDNPRLKSLSFMPDGPRKEDNPAFEEPRGTMELALTHLPQNKGVFISSMCGGAIYYAPDVTVPKPKFRQVWDVTAYSNTHYPERARGEGCAGSSWIQISQDDKFVYNAVIGRGAGSTSTGGADVAKQVYTLDVRKLLKAGANAKCSIDNLQEARFGGSESDCPTLADSFLVNDRTTGGPHWGAEDNLIIGKDGFYHETRDVRRIAFTNYFVARTNVDGNHQVCILDISDEGRLSRDESFLDEFKRQPCVDFDRRSWPHGDFGDAKPHSMVFATADKDIR